LVLVSSSWTQCFRIQPGLHPSFPCTRQSINWYHSAWFTPIKIIIQGLQSSRLFLGFKEFPFLSKVYRVLVSIQCLQSFRLFPGFTEILSLSSVYRVSISIQCLQSFRLFQGFTEFPSLSRVYRVPVSLQGL